MCAKKQSIPLLEVWHVLPTSFYLSSTSHSEITKKRIKISRIYEGLCIVLMLGHESTSSFTLFKENLLDSVNLLFLWKSSDCSSVFFLRNSFRHPHLGTHTCFPRKHFSGFLKSGMTLKSFHRYEQKPY